MLLGVLALLLLLIGLALFVPARLEASGDLSVRPPGDAADAADAYWLEILALAGADAGLGDAGHAVLPPFRGRVAGRLTWMGGALAVDERGVILFGRRVGGRGRPAKDREPAAKGRGRVLRIRGRRRKAGERPREAPEKLDSRRQDGWRRKSRRLAIGPAAIRRLLPAAWKALLKVWSALKLRMKMQVTFGAGDPVSTGLLAASVASVVYPVARAANARRPGSLDLRLEPVFDREVLAATFNLSGNTSLFALSWPLVRFALRRDVRKLWWPGRRRRVHKSEEEAA